MELDEEGYGIRTYFRVNRILLAGAGMWPYQPIVSARIIQILWFFQHMSIMIPEIIRLIEDRHDADLVIEMIPPIFYNSCIAILFLNSIFHHNKIKHILQRINEDWASLTDKMEIKTLTYYADVGKVITWIYIGSIYYVLVIFCLFPLAPIAMDFIKPLNESRPKAQLYRVQLFIDDEKYFWSILTHAYITSFIGITPLLAIDIFLANAIQHICGMFTILGQRLENSLKNKSYDEPPDKEMYKVIVDCAKLHTKILDSVDCFNDAFSTAFGIALLVLVILLSITGLVVIIKWGNWNDVIRFGLFTMAELFHIFCYSFHSQLLIDYNNKLYISICNSGWFEGSVETQKLVKIMLLRSLKPCLIKCLIFPLSMENFTTVIKTSFSYFTVIQSSL